MEYIKVSEVAERWEVSVHRVQELCKQGRIAGAKRFGTNWMIPADAARPIDGRRKEAKNTKKENLAMPRRSPILVMTDLYHIPGSAQQSANALSHIPEAKELFEAEIAYCRGEIDTVYEYAQYFLKHHTGFYAIVGAGMLLSFCAIWNGDVHLWHEAKKHIAEAPCKNDDDREMLSLALAAADSTAFEHKDFPAWFERGNFELLLPDSHPAAKVFYAKWLYMAAYGVASKQVALEGVQGLVLMRMVPYTIEPLISQAVVDKTIIPEIHLRLLCAVSYHNSGNDALAIEHIDRAVALALPDRLFGILAEYWRQLDYLLKERLALVDADAAKETKVLYKRYSVGLSKLSSVIRNRYVASHLTPREHEVAKLVSFGFSTRRIAAKLCITESAVKQTVAKIMQKTGLDDRSEFVYLL